MTITTPSLRDGVVEPAVRRDHPSATGRNRAHHLEFCSGLPAGISLSAAGVLSGTPTVAGSGRDDHDYRDGQQRYHRKSATFMYPANIAAASEHQLPRHCPAGAQSVTYPALAMQASWRDPALYVDRKRAASGDDNVVRTGS